MKKFTKRKRPVSANVPVDPLQATSNDQPSSDSDGLGLNHPYTPPFVAPRHTHPVQATSSEQSRNGSEGFRLSHPYIPPFIAPAPTQYYGAPISYQASHPYSIQHPGLAEALSATVQRWWSIQLQRQHSGGPTQSWSQ